MLRYVGFVVALVLLAAGWFAVGPWIFVLLLVALLVPATRRRMRPSRWLLGGLAAVVAAAAAVVVVLPDGRLPIPPGGGLLVTPSYDGHAVDAQPIELACRSTRAWRPTAAARCTTTAGRPTATPGRGRWGAIPRWTTSWYGLKECATLAFDPEGRLVALCGNRTGPVMHVLDPETMRPVETFDLPDREESDKRPWEDLCGGAYFYLDPQARAVVATTDRRILTVDSDGLEVLDEVDLGDVVPDDDCLVALLPDWEGNAWYVTQDGRVGVAGGTGDLDPAGPRWRDRQLDRRRRHRRLPGHHRGVATRSRSTSNRQPAVLWQAAYDNGSGKKPGQLSAGSGTTPTVLPSGLVAITDNADPQMHVQFYDAIDGAWSARPRCSVRARAPPTTHWSRSATPASWSRTTTATTAPWSTMAGRATTGGLARVDADPDTGECTVGWRSDEVAPTSVAKVSLATGLVYAYTTRASWWGVSAWYLTAIDARTGETAFSVRTGTGTLFNNHYSAVTLGPDGSAYVATLGGMVRVRDSD